jgi:hypothetical protein
MDRRPIAATDALVVSVPRRGGQTPEALLVTTVRKIVKKCVQAPVT